MNINAIVNRIAGSKRAEAVKWIESQNTKYARTLQEKAKYLVGKTSAGEMPHPSVWNEVLKISRGLRASNESSVVSTTKTFKCPNCDTKVLENTGYCLKCKKKVKKAADTFECPDCGTKVLENTGYCVKCKKKVKKAREAAIASRIVAFVEAIDLSNLPRMSLSEIASLIYEDHRQARKQVNYAAKPYLEAMTTLRSIKDNYMMDSGSSVVAYLLGNLSSWTGSVARAVKSELKKRLKTAR